MKLTHKNIPGKLTGLIGPPAGNVVKKPSDFIVQDCEWYIGRLSNRFVALAVNSDKMVRL